ncbi:MAG: hypothetical protein GXO73_05925 [Calditrichaeota bacterium]|nr:hypothetical protein [Calditrichota bacterium]
MTEVVVGVDGGGTSTNVAVVALDGRVLARAQGGTSNYQVIGGEKLAEVLRETIEAALQKAKVEVPQVRHLVVALAGVGRPSDREAVSKVVANLGLSQRSTVDSDAAAALAGAFAGGEGIIVISGTGTICFGKGADGRVERSGGWGYLLGDEGSGYWIGQQALIAALKDLDGRGPRTALREALEKHLGVERIDRVIPRVYQGDLDRAGVAALAPLVFEVAAQGDAVAQEIVNRAGEELGRLAAAVAKRLTWSTDTVKIAPIGSVFKQRAVLEPGMKRVLDEAGVKHAIVDPLLDPALGAAVIGLQKEAVSVTGSVLDNLLGKAS